jgi:zinc transport system permease protein
MGGLAAIIGVGSAVIGLQASAQFDTPAGPSIVCIAALIFVLTQGAAGVRKR